MSTQTIEEAWDYYLSLFEERLFSVYKGDELGLPFFLLSEERAAERREFWDEVERVEDEFGFCFDYETFREGESSSYRKMRFKPADG